MGKYRRRNNIRGKDLSVKKKTGGNKYLKGKNDGENSFLEKFRGEATGGGCTGYPYNYLSHLFVVNYATESYFKSDHLHLLNDFTCFHLGERFNIKKRTGSKCPVCIYIEYNYSSFFFIANSLGCTAVFT